MLVDNSTHRRIISYITTDSFSTPDGWIPLTLKGWDIVVVSAYASGHILIPFRPGGDDGAWYAMVLGGALNIERTTSVPGITVVYIQFY